MEMSSRVLGQEHTGTLASMANLAATYKNQGRWNEAEGLEVQIMETSSRCSAKSIQMPWPAWPTLQRHTRTRADGTRPGG